MVSEADHGGAHSVALRLAPHDVGGRVRRPGMQLRAQVRRKGLRRVLCGTRRVAVVSRGYAIR